MNKEKDILLSRWLSGDLSDEEKESLQEHTDLEQLSDNLKLLEELKLPDPNVERIWAGVDHETSKPKQKAKIRILPYLMAAAASVAIFFIAFTVFGNSEVSYQTKVGESLTVRLPDQSEVILNGYTSLTYDKKAWKNNRSLDLDGEAFFKVAKGSTFTVNTDQGMVEVLGTIFNVEDRDEELVVSCFEGRVKVSSSDGRTNQQITAGERVSIKDAQLSDVTKIADNNPSWINKLVKFNNKTLREVFNSFQYYYPVKIDFKHNVLSRRFTGTIPTDNLQEAVEIVCQGMDLNCEVDQNVVRISAK